MYTTRYGKLILAIRRYLLPQTLKTTRLPLSMLASPYIALTSAGVAQSALRTCACQSSRARLASAYRRLLSQNRRSVRFATILIGRNYHVPKMGTSASRAAHRLGRPG